MLFREDTSEMPSVARLCALLLLLLPAPCRAADQDQPGRDFSKTLIFDEPGIDDEISLPTFIDAPQYEGGRESKLNVELDKRLTETLSVQTNIGYSMLREATAPIRNDGWQKTDVTLKYIAYANPEAEQLASVSLTRKFGGTGAARIGAETTSATTAAVNAGPPPHASAPPPAHALETVNQLSDRLATTVDNDHLRAIAPSLWPGRASTVQYICSWRRKCDRRYLI
jgi:hypothetical protein